MSQLEIIRSRIQAVREARLTPRGAWLSRDSWATIKAEFAAERGLGGRPSLRGEDVLGIPVKTHPGILGDFISHDDGLEPIR